MADGETESIGEKLMTDWHVHTGQWHEIYYNPEAVVRALKSGGVDEFYFSSTTSEVFCKESVMLTNEAIRASAPTARELYEAVKGEVQAALDMATEVGAKAHPLYWVIPEVHFALVVSVAESMSEIAYKGFKIHPRGNRWDLRDAKTAALAEEVFAYAEAHDLFVLIHCGHDDFEKPALFEKFIAAHPNVTVQLAHSRPLSDTLEMLKKYPNTVCDTAFTPDADSAAIKAAGFGKRIRYGTDFPITHYWKMRPKSDPTEAELAAFLCGNGL